MKRGEVYWAEQKGCRPVIVNSHDGFNQSPGWRSAIVIPVSTSASQRREGRRLLDRAKLTKRAGILPSEVVREVEDGIRAAVDLD